MKQIGVNEPDRVVDLVGHACGQLSDRRHFLALQDLALQQLDVAQVLKDRHRAQGPTFANGITKTQLHQEWSMSLDQAIEAEAQAQAICMQTHDFERAYRAFAAKERPKFKGD